MSHQEDSAENFSCVGPMQVARLAKTLKLHHPTRVRAEPNSHRSFSPLKISGSRCGVRNCVGWLDLSVETGTAEGASPGFLLARGSEF